MTDEQKAVALVTANELSQPHSLGAEFLGEAMSVGVGGDFRTYTPVLCLIGPWPGHEVLQKLSTKMSNITNINRVTVQIESPSATPAPAKP